MAEKDNGTDTLGWGEVEVSTTFIPDYGIGNLSNEGDGGFCIIG
jgi:hypothetical protein